MLIDAINAALKDREKSFNGGGMDGAANVFLGGVRHGEMTVKLPAHAGIDMRFVGHEAAIPMNVPADNRAQDLGSHVRDMQATDHATPLDQRHDRKLGLGSLISAVLGLRADIGFVGLDSPSFAADWGKERIRLVVHSLTDA